MLGKAKNLLTVTFCSDNWKCHCHCRGKRHKTTIDWMAQMIMQLSRWLGERMVLLVVGGGFACVYLAQVCIRCGWGLVSKRRLDASLYDFSEAQFLYKKDPKPSKKLPPPEEPMREAQKQGKKAAGKWYG